MQIIAKKYGPANLCPEKLVDGLKNISEYTKGNFLSLFGINSYKVLLPLLDKINILSDQIDRLSDSELAAKTEAFRKRYGDGEKLEDILPEAFAVVRAVSSRVLGQRQEDLQMIGAIALHQGMIAEMATGEGKTLTSVPAAYLNAISGRRVHIITSNDYLAKRDRFWMGKIFEFLGLRVDFLWSGMGFDERRKAYRANITYGASSEFVFDYLRDYKIKSEDNGFTWNYIHGVTACLEDRCIQSGLHYAIIDEIDSILIDSGTNPLSLSESVGTLPIVHIKAFEMACLLIRDRHFTLDEKKKEIEVLMDKIKQDHELPDALRPLPEEECERYLLASLRALHLLEKDKDYIVREKKIVLVDPFTGRLAPQRTFGTGLHQALEVKENVPISQETKTSLSMSYALYFKHYKKLAGMTGTARDDAREFKKIYGLKVMALPTSRPLQRVRYSDLLFRSEAEKFNAVVEAIKSCIKVGRPVLVGTNSVQKCEELSELLEKHGIEHSVISARNHEKEADIIARAGQLGRVTVATNMAGRGVDIVLGEGIAELGGLHVIATEHHDASRIDDQLFGRAGRRGDPGSAQVLASLEDDLLRIYRMDKKIQRRIKRVANRKGEPGTPVRSRAIDRAMRRAQKIIQKYRFQVRMDLMDRATKISEWRESENYDPFIENWSHLVF